MILFDIASGRGRLDGWKKDLWENCHIGIPWQDKEANDAVIFGFLVNWFFAKVVFINICTISNVE